MMCLMSGHLLLYCCLSCIPVFIDAAAFVSPGSDGARGVMFISVDRDRTRADVCCSKGSIVIRRLVSCSGSTPTQLGNVLFSRLVGRDACGNEIDKERERGGGASAGSVRSFFSQV